MGTTRAYTYDYPMPAVTVDCVVFGWDDDDLHVLLIERGEKPFEGQAALPGGFIQVGRESLEQAARRELEEETGIRNYHLEQLGTFGNPDRDPRYHVVTVAYFALVRKSDHRPRGGTDARSAAWCPLDEVPSLAFDHDEILAVAKKRLYGKLRYKPLGFQLLPRKFPLRDLQRLYETASGGEVDKRNFRKKVLEMGILEDLNETESDVAHRAARLYRFNESAYRKRSRDGWQFEL